MPDITVNAQENPPESSWVKGQRIEAAKQAENQQRVAEQNKEMYAKARQKVEEQGGLNNIVPHIATKQDLIEAGCKYVGVSTPEVIRRTGKSYSTYECPAGSKFSGIGPGNEGGRARWGCLENPDRDTRGHTVITNEWRLVSYWSEIKRGECVREAGGADLREPSEDESQGTKVNTQKMVEVFSSEPSTQREEQQ